MAKTPRDRLSPSFHPDTTGGSPPRDLGQHGRKFWDEVQAAYGIDDSGGRELLAQACAALDPAEG